MVVRSEVLAAITTGFKTVFNKSFAAKAPQWEKVATRVPSSTGDEIYPWLGALPRFREWIGDRVVKALAENGYRIKNKLFEMTVAVPKTAIEDDQYGVYSPLMEQMGVSAAEYPDDLIFSLLKKGFTELCYDGTPFFGSHKVGKRTISNAGTAKLTPDSYGAARAAMMSLVDEEGNPMKLIPDLLVVPPALEAAALKILKADIIGNETNIYKGTAEVLVVPELAGKDTAWYLLDTSKALKPLIFQERKKPEFVTLTEPTDENVFMRSEYIYGCEARGNAGFGLWQQAYGSDGTAST